jgi:hypothetical protein
VKKICIIFVFLFFNTSCLNAKNVGNIYDHQLEVSFDRVHSILYCKSIIVLDYDERVLKFNLNRDAKIQKVFLNEHLASYDFKKGLLEVKVNLKISKPYTLRIEYFIKFSNKPPKMISDFEDPSAYLISYISNDSVYIGSNVIWYPQCNVQPKNMEITFISNDNSEYLTEGRRIEHVYNGKSTISKWKVSNYVKSLSIIGGNYKVLKRNFNDIQVFVYLFDEHKHLLETYADKTIEYIKFYSEKIGKFPFDNYAVLETILPVGISYPTYTIISKDIIPLSFVLDTSLPHEILHSWFGHGVLVDYSKGNWSEGLVTYLSDYLLKERNSVDAKEYLKKMLYDFSTIVNEKNDFPLKRFTGRYDLVSRVIGYEKSAMFFHYLRYLVGNDKFFKSVGHFYKKNLFHYATWDDLRQSFEEISGINLKPIFKEWLEREDVPDFFILNASKRKKDKSWLLEVTVSQNKPFYTLKLPISVYDKNNKIIHKIDVMLDSNINVFNIKTDDEPYRVVLDEDINVLRRLYSDEIPVTINTLKASDKTLIILTQKSNNLVDIFTKSMTLKNVTISSSNLKGFYNIVYFNFLQEKDLGFLKISKDFIYYHDKKYDLKDAAYFVVFRENDKIISLFYAPLIFAEKIAKKITHYGSYSFLIFVNDKVVEKGTIEPKKQRNIYILGEQNG